jgi:tartronate-semialdehyde synthase
MVDVQVDLQSYTPLPISRKKPQPSQLAQAIQLLDSAKNPLIIAGGGVVLSHAEKELLEFAEWMKIPVITTYMSKGLIPEDHYLNAGMVGIQVGASSSGNAIFLESDVVLGIGCRFTDRHTGALDVYKGERKFIHIDVDPKEIGKLIVPVIGIESDALEALNGLLELVKAQDRRVGSKRVEHIASLKKQAMLKGKLEGEMIDPRDVFIMVDEVFSDNALFTTGCGLNQIWSGQYQKINKPRVYLPSGGAGTLGFDIPAAIGASVGANNKKAVCMMGDFGFTFLVEELGVASKYHLPIVVIILNNGYLSLIRQNQKYAYKYEYEVSMEENLDIIDYVKVSEGFGCLSERVSSYKGLTTALQRAKKATGPYVIDVIVDREVDCNMGNDLTHIAKFD